MRSSSAGTPIRLSVTGRVAPVAVSTTNASGGRRGPDRIIAARVPSFEIASGGWNPGRGGRAPRGRSGCGRGRPPFTSRKLPTAPPPPFPDPPRAGPPGGGPAPPPAVFRRPQPPPL